MSDILSVAVTALRADQTKLEQLSLNTANATTPGYRRSVVTATNQFDAAMVDAQQASTTSGSVLHPQLPVPVLARSVDLSKAAFTQTGKPFDVAIEGNAFIALTDGTKTYLTKHGALALNQDNELVGKSGFRVLGVKGDIRLDGAEGVSIQPDGSLTRGEQMLGQIRLVQINDAQALRSSDGVLFETDPQNMSDISASEVKVRAGFLEASNTDNLQEMLGVLENTRHFESLIRLVQGYDEVLGKAIQRLGEV